MSIPSKNLPIDPDRKGDSSSFPKSKKRSTTKLVWILRLLPAVLFACHTYVAQGPFQSRTCLIFGRNCRSNTDVYMDASINVEKENYYNPVVQYYKSLFQTHEDIGGSLSVFVNGQETLNIFAGSKDLEGRINYDDLTLQQVYSSGKAVEGIVMAQLVDKGLVDYEAPVSKYWPEFAVSGKENVRIVDVMTHESGVFYLDDKLRDLTWESLKDQAAFSARLAGQKHFFDGEIKRAYQAVSRGWYLNEIVRRVDPQGRTIGQIARQELMADYKDVELYYSHFDNDSDWEKRLSPMVDYPVLRIIGRLLLPRAVQTNKWFGYPEMAPLHPLRHTLQRAPASL
ncbi:hypothetical protein EMPS_07085 [Entomortierella parvispora]|uniref:Beta-lactamase-related domain-containing protein n=1 Tax=Entomortierella parvispora TaxID=205924 RepID=A0A9P3HDN7_9FUNG|nr:hypothetical protein EMPS_07085 [Entomortierella parvispora]